MTENLPEGLLASAVAGDLGAWRTVRQVSHSGIRDAASRTGDLVVRKAGVRAVMIALRAGHTTTEEAQAWASFVRRGYVAGGSGPITPIGIDFEPDPEEVVADCVSRLDELGDLVDGDISVAELEAMIERCGG